jgi:pyridoxal phosphate enzyme (YggS family)|tara:strand:- start:493 stop:1158 length:666 start_codon:yes stop_codon:yes gene_type:complete
MHNTVDNLVGIEKEIQLKLEKKDKKINYPKIIAVSKTFPIQNIFPLINHGQIHYGENKVQEAIEKWIDIKKDFDHIKLHMLGNLQSNKVKFVVPLFDYIHSLDNLKLAKKISDEQHKNNKSLKIFIQVNIGKEEQKNGINEEDLKSFYDKCVNELNLEIIGLMCLPPKNDNSKNYFLKMKELATQLNITELSMGMSSDYLQAAENGATYLRIGSKIFGQRG